MENRICPILESVIDDGLCFDICMVAEGVAPERTVPNEVTIKPNMKEICLKCRYCKD